MTETLDYGVLADEYVVLPGCILISCLDTYFVHVYFAARRHRFVLVIIASTNSITLLDT